MPCRCLAKENPRAWQLEANPSPFKASASPLLSPPSSPQPLKKGGYPCVEYTACNFAVKPQLRGQCCDWLCKDLSLKGNYTKFSSEGQLSLDRIQEKPHIVPLCVETLGSLWLSPALRQRDTLRHSDSSEPRLQGDKTRGHREIWPNSKREGSRGLCLGTQGSRWPRWCSAPFGVSPL